MRFIPTRLHAPLDYIVGAGLIAAPWISQFSEHTAATVIPIVLGIGLIAYSLFTNYELGVWKVAPMAVHNLIDIAAGALLAASPWIFGFADQTANVWVPHLVVGLAAIFLGLTTKQVGGYRYGKSADTATTATSEPSERAAGARRPRVSRRHNWARGGDHERST
jgi:SPW repeat-containing protein